MNVDRKNRMLAHAVSVVVVLGLGLVLSVSGMNPAAAAGVAGITVASVEGSSRWRVTRCRGRS